MSLSRRSFLLGSSLSATLAAGAPALAQFAAPTSAGPFSSVSVDVTPLRAQGLGAYAEFVRSALQTELQQVFADRLGRGPRLVVRITGIYLASYSGGGGGGRHGGGTAIERDNLDGEALIVGPRGEVLARYPQLSAVPAAGGGAWYDPQSEQRRVLNLAQHYAWWLRRTISG